MRSEDGTDLAAALAWVESSVGPVESVRELSGGMTSTMLALRTHHDDLVLRLMTREPWRSHGSRLAARERQVQGWLGATPVPAPVSRALDAEGAHCGHPAHLMSLLPGQVDTGHVDPASLDRLADVLGAVHAVPPPQELRPYESWAWEAKFVVPESAGAPALWRDAFALLRRPPPEHAWHLVHRDFSLRNVLWSGDQVTGVVDWVETSVGPAWLDVAHCSTNIALTHGSDRADAFAAAYVGRTGVAPQPWFDVMDVVGFLPPPGRAPFAFSPDQHQRLEERLEVVLHRARADG